MQEIIEGVHKFQAEVYPGRKALFDDLANQQSPEVLFVTCADSRIDPHLITQTAPGDLFVCRNAGNIVPPYGADGEAMTASIEYAVAVLRVKHIVVCGHSDCGAMKGAMNLEALNALPNVKEWLGHSRTAVEVVRALGFEGADEELRRLTEENVLLQLVHLKSHPAVAAKLAAGELTLHAWIYEIGTGGVCCSAPESRDFKPLAEHYAGEG